MNKEISIAPMMNYTTEHFRCFMRGITRCVRLYTEMITTQQLLYGNHAQRLRLNQVESPVALQLGGGDVEQLKQCVELAQEWGYQEINLNVGCPSSRIQKGEMGACLFKMPERVAECVQVMRKYSNIPITVKTRLGVDDRDKDEDIIRFVELVAQAGCKTLIIHARKAWLKGVNPRQNRSLPPLQYDRALQFKLHFPQLRWILNGGIQTKEQLHQQLSRFDGVMIGRAACQNPFMFASVDADYFGVERVVNRRQVLLDYRKHFLQNARKTTRRNHLIKPLVHLLHGAQRAKLWRAQCAAMSSSDVDGLELYYDKLIDYVVNEDY